MKIATVNPERGVMRRMMRLAHARGWVSRDIFYGACECYRVMMEE